MAPLGQRHIPKVGKKRVPHYVSWKRRVTTRKRVALERDDATVAAARAEKYAKRKRKSNAYWKERRAATKRGLSPESAKITATEASAATN